MKNKFILPILFLSVLVLLYLTLFYLQISIQPSTNHEFKSIKTFSSEQDFKTYLREASLSSSSYYGFGTVYFTDVMRSEAEPALLPGEIKSRGLEEEPSRVSETNVQVLGIDEPDIVKTNGKEIYFSKKDYYWRYYYEKDSSRNTKVIKAFPPDNLKILEEIPKTGDLLLHENMLVVLSYNKIYGYDISSPENPEKKWDIELNSSFISARLYNDKIYLVTKKYIDTYHPCPIVPLRAGEKLMTIGCSRIYHPVNNIPVDTTYNVFSINIESGEVEDSLSFVGTSGSSVVYMSKNAIYITYEYYEDYFEFIYNFLKEKMRDVIPSNIIAKLEKLETYDISSQAKMVEVTLILEEYFASLDEDETAKIMNEFTNRMEDYYKEHNRDLEKTGISKIGLDFKVKANGEIPGRLLNQFSLDEYNNYLRIATTTGRWSDSTNDLYVLNNNLEIVGKILDLGVEERIYSVRFIGDVGYIVTFRETDPFFVIDLSNPEKPELKGELKIPGYSSYLHPIDKNTILGIGKEDRRVKISLFDVSSPENPKEKDKYNLEDYWSEVESTHHAFLLDAKHKIFFLPGRNGGYIFSYKNDNLKLEKVVTNISARRAVYIDDYLYIVGDDKIVVLDETSWDKIKELEL